MNKNKLKVRTGFLMIDNIVSLLFCGMGVGLICLAMQNLINQTHSYQLDYQLFLRTIESNDFKFKLVDINPNTIYFYSPKTRKKYRLTKYNDTLRLQGLTKGHIPVLEHVKEASWKSQSTTQILIKGEFDNGEKFSSVSIFNGN
ncbi:competence type IV pilus minor pilin ComGF [Lentilactobacillus senioris]|uniref:competence type IV pilus minor pilin ComGF n=1 Tax=Lentilactobacillus senioris TaxID=931534 RepID=UPI003D272CC4